MKEAREVLTEHILKTEATWNVYPTADSILSALDAAGYVVVDKGFIEWAESTRKFLKEGGEAMLTGALASSSTKAQR